MAPLRKQTTISRSVSVSGYGFWSGRDIDLNFQPAEANTGIVFVRSDLPGQPRIPAVIQNRINGPRRTTLVAEGCPVEMVEHVLAALAGLKIDNCEIHATRAEMPGDDGSSKAFTDALSQAGLVELEAERQTIRVTSSIRVGDENTWIQADPVEQDQFELAYQLDYACSSIGTQTYQTQVTPEIFAKEIAPARTFVLLEEAQELQKKGLGQRVSFKDILVFGPDGPIDNQVRFENECARHKLLDMIGDFSLSGTDLIGKFTASKSGHRLNSQLVFALLQQIGHTNTIRKSA
ncbi:MAG: UDP-3-O-acyl-N-acetylglucosamine deacetylase [Mariniblastus sp.]